MANQDVRAAIETARIRYWQIANAYGCTDGSLSRKLRCELPKTEKEKIFAIVEELKAERDKGAG